MSWYWIFCFVFPLPASTSLATCELRTLVHISCMWENKKCIKEEFQCWKCVKEACHLGIDGSKRKLRMSLNSPLSLRLEGKNPNNHLVSLLLLDIHDFWCDSLRTLSHTRNEVWSYQPIRKDHTVQKETWACHFQTIAIIFISTSNNRGTLIVSTRETKIVSQSSLPLHKVITLDFHWERRTRCQLDFSNFLHHPTLKYPTNGICAVAVLSVSNHSRGSRRNNE